MAAPADKAIRVMGRYALYGEIATGGMATVHYGRLLGPVGFSRTVAIKRLHAELARDPQFVAMFLDEARLAARIAHPNVVATLDVVAEDSELFLVMEYVQGESLARLFRASRARGDPILPSIAAGIMVGALNGLHAAHESKNERGEPLGLVHRDISPQNVLVGADGIARLIDFGVAKAVGRIQTTRSGRLKGKLAYMAPEQLEGRVDRSTDLYAAAIVLWELLAGERLFAGQNEGEVFRKVTEGVKAPPSEFAPGIPPALDAVVLRGLSRSPGARFANARDMARAIEDSISIAGASRIGEWVDELAHEQLTQRAALVASIETGSHPAEGEAPPPSGAVSAILTAAERSKPPEQAQTSTELTSSSPSLKGQGGGAPARRWVLALGVLALLILAGIWGSARFAHESAPPIAATPATAAIPSTPAATPSARVRPSASLTPSAQPEASAAAVSSAVQPASGPANRTPSTRAPARKPLKKASQLDQVLDTHE